MKYFISQLTGIILKSHQKCSLLVIYFERLFSTFTHCALLLEVTLLLNIQQSMKNFSNIIIP